MEFIFTKKEKELMLFSCSKFISGVQKVKNKDTTVTMAALKVIQDRMKSSLSITILSKKQAQVLSNMVSLVANRLESITIPNYQKRIEKSIDLVEVDMYNGYITAANEKLEIFKKISKKIIRKIEVDK